MSISTHISFHNSKDPKYLAATSTYEGTMAWEEDNGPVAERPGPSLEDTRDSVLYTDAEYGGWVIDLAKIPPGTTHIAIERY